MSSKLQGTVDVFNGEMAPGVLKEGEFCLKFCIGNWKQKILLDTKNTSFGCPVILSPFLLASILILVYSITAVSDVFLPLLCTKTLPLQLLQLFYWGKIAFQSSLTKEEN